MTSSLSLSIYFFSVFGSFLLFFFLFFKAPFSFKFYRNSTNFLLTIFNLSYSLDRSVDSSFSGTTCVLAVIRDDQLWVANVGDSRVILAREEEEGKFVPVEVSIDHKPECKYILFSMMGNVFVCVWSLFL